jgi:signal transduction histidine kinase
MDKIFKKFYQADTSTTREKGGSGLGLAICKGIIEAHGSEIQFESELGRGTTFSFILPKTQKSVI